MQEVGKTGVKWNMDRDIIVRETLPYPYAHYCDAFIGFHRELATGLTFCECQQEAITNHLAMCAIVAENHKQHQRLPWYVNAYSDYPRSLLRLVSAYSSEPHKVMRRFMTFAPHLCHRCNKMPIYGSYGFSDVPSNYFISHFRPYVNQQFYELGLHPSGHIALPNKCPESIKVMDEAQRQVHVENLVREAFCFPRCGINRNQESMLFLLVRSILPGCTVIQHHRPAWLDGLELDIFIQEHNIGIEFQGVQHSEPMDHLGGERAFKAVRRRDKKKVTLCKANGVRLLHIQEGEELKESVIRFALLKDIPALPAISPQRVEELPCDFFLKSNGITSRWTNHHDKGNLSVSVESPEMSFYVGGTDYSITIKYKAETVISIRVWMQRSSGAASFTLPIHESEQEIKLRPCPRRIMDVFRVWATFDPNIAFQEEKRDNPTPNETSLPLTRGGSTET